MLSILYVVTIYSCNNGLCLVLSYARVLNNDISLGTLSVNVNRQPVIGISYTNLNPWLEYRPHTPQVRCKRLGTAWSVEVNREMD